MLTYYCSCYFSKPLYCLKNFLFAALLVAVALSFAPSSLPAQTNLEDESALAPDSDSENSEIDTLWRQVRFEYATEDFTALADTLERIRIVDSENRSLVLYGQILQRHLDAKRLATVKDEKNPFLGMLPAERSVVRPQPKPTPISTPAPPPPPEVVASVEGLSPSVSSSATQPIALAQATPVAPINISPRAGDPLLLRTIRPPVAVAPKSFLSDLASMARDANPIIWGAMILGGVCFLFLGLYLLRWSRSEPLPAQGFSSASPPPSEVEEIPEEEEEDEIPQTTLSDILTSKLTSVQEDTEEYAPSVDPEEPPILLGEGFQIETVSEEDFTQEPEAPEEDTILVLDDILSTPDSDEGSSESDESARDGSGEAPPPFPMDDDTLFNSDAETREIRLDDLDSSGETGPETGNKGPDRETFFGSDDETRQGDPQA